VAKRIREMAEKHKIPIVRNHPSPVCFMKPPISMKKSRSSIIRLVAPRESVNVYKLKGKAPIRPPTKPNEQKGPMPTLNLKK